MKTSEWPLLDPGELKGLLERGECVLIDVREGVEWSQGHVPGCRLLPLGELERRCGEVPEEGRVVLMCAAGKRSRRAAELLKARGFGNVEELEGGMQAWESAQMEVARPASAPWALERQVRFAAGLLVVAGLSLGLVWPAAVYLSWFVGIGLLVAALTNWCGMALLLAKAPWNRPRLSRPASNPTEGEACSLGGG